MWKKYKILILLLGIFVVGNIVIGTSYAIWKYVAVQEEVNAINSDCFEISFADKNEININDMVPMTETLGNELSPYSFKIKNICNHGVDYDVNIETLDGSTLDSSNVRFKLNYLDSKLLSKVPENSSSTFVNSNAIKSHKVAGGYLKPGFEKEYNLRIWMDEDTTFDQGVNKSFASKIAIVATLDTTNDTVTLVDGKTFNSTIKQLANPDEEVDSDFEDAKIRSISFTNQLPSEDINIVNVSVSEDNPIYAWYDAGNIYLCSFGKIVYMNSDSSELFSLLMNVKDLDLNMFDTSNVEDMSYMFGETYSLESVDLSLFNTSKVTNMESMFNGMSSLIEIDVSNFNTSNLENMSCMFCDDSSLEILDVSNFDTLKVTDMSWLFSGLKKIQNLNVSSFDTSNVTSMKGMFSDMHSLITIDVSNFNTSNVENMSCMFSDMNSLTDVNVSSLDTSNVTDMSSMFSDMHSLTSLDLSNFDTSKVTYMSWLFSGSNKIQNLNISSFNTSKVSDMNYMFYGMSSLVNLNISNFDTSKVTSMQGMFKGMQSLTSLNLSNFNTSNVTSMRGMFESMNNIEELDLSSFDTSNVTDMVFMFNKMTSLETIVVSDKWDTLNVSSGSYMFSNSTKLVGGQGTTYDEDHTNKEYARVDDPDNGKPGYLTLKTN